MDLDPKIINDWKFIKYVSAQKMIGVEEDFVKDRLEKVCEAMKDVIKVHEQYMAYGAEKNFTFPLTAFQNTVDADHINAVVTITQKDDNNTMQAELVITPKDSEEPLLDAVVTKEKKDYTYDGHYTYDGLCFGIIMPYLQKICRDMSTDYTNAMKDYTEKMANLAHLTDDFALEYENWERENDYNRD